MTLRDIVDSIIKEVQGGVRSMDSKFSYDYVKSLVNSYRATVLRSQFSKSKRIHPSWTQQYFPDFSEDIQDDKCCVKFQVPESIILNDQVNGYLYVGEVNGNCSYSQLNSRADLSTYSKHRVTKGVVKFIYSDGVIELYGNTELKVLRVDAVFRDPTNITMYNEDFDNYPIDGDSLNQLKDILVKSELLRQAQSPADINQNILDETVIKGK